MTHLVSFTDSRIPLTLKCRYEGDKFRLFLFKEMGKPPIFSWPTQFSAGLSTITAEDELTIEQGFDDLGARELFLLFITWKEVREDTLKIESRPYHPLSLEEWMSLTSNRIQGGIPFISSEYLRYFMFAGLLLTGGPVCIFVPPSNLMIGKE